MNKQKNTKIFGLINLFDLFIFSVVILFTLGYFLVKTGHSNINKIIKSEGTAEVKIVVKGAKAINPEIFKKNDTAFITIRNQPYAKVKVIDAQFKRREIRFLSKDEKRLITFPDYDDPYSLDIVFTISDRASMIEDGIVMGGNKVKIGIPIELESFDYRLTGTVAEVKFIPDKE